MPLEWNNALIVTVDELVPAFYNTEATLRSEVSRHRNKDYGIKQVCKGGNGRRALYAFDSLEKEIQNALGDPRKISNPLELYYKTDKAAVDFFTKEFRFEDGEHLRLKHQEEYITNASVLIACIQLKATREYERKSKGGSCKGIMATICNDAALFNKVLKVKYNLQHTLPASEKRFKETFRQFENGFNYESLISGKHRLENARKVTDEVMQLLNDMFTDVVQKPSRTQIAKKYEAFLSGYLDVISTTTGEVYEPSSFKPLSDGTIINYLEKWQEAIGTKKLRSGNRQKYMGTFSTYHSTEKPTYAGSIISIDDRQPPFKYAGNNRPWMYMGIDLASEAWICAVHGKSKEGIIIEFYQKLVRNFHKWGLNMPNELECEMSLNSSFTNTFLQEGRLFQTVRMEANNARGKKIERYFGELRYRYEKEREGWLARPHAMRESNQAGPKNAFSISKDEGLSKAPIIPYNKIIEGCFIDIERWNNQPHSVHTDKTRWQVFKENQHPDLKPINWHAILPHLGYETHTTCQLNGIINLNNCEFLPGVDGYVALSDQLITIMKKIAGKAITVRWLDNDHGNVIKAHVYLKDSDAVICEAVPKPVYQRATIERTPLDEDNYKIMSVFAATIDRYGREKAASINKVILIDKTPELPKTFVMDELAELRRRNGNGGPCETQTEEPEILNTEDDNEEMETVPAQSFFKPLKERW